MRKPALVISGILIWVGGLYLARPQLGSSLSPPSPAPAVETSENITNTPKDVRPPQFASAPLVAARPIQNSPNKSPTTEPTSTEVFIDSENQKELTKCTGFSDTTLESFATRLLAKQGNPIRSNPLLINHHFRLENGQMIRLHQSPQDENESSELKLSIFKEDDEGLPDALAEDPETKGKSTVEMLAHYRTLGKVVLEQERRVYSYADKSEIEIQRANHWVEAIELKTPNKTLSCGILFESENEKESVACKCITNPSIERTD